MSSYHVLGNEVTGMRKTESHSHGTYILGRKETIMAKQIEEKHSDKDNV